MRRERDGLASFFVCFTRLRRFSTLSAISLSAPRSVSVEGRREGGREDPAYSLSLSLSLTSLSLSLTLSQTHIHIPSLSVCLSVCLSLSLSLSRSLSNSPTPPPSLILSLSLSFLVHQALTGCTKDVPKHFHIGVASRTLLQVAKRPLYFQCGFCWSIKNQPGPIILMLLKFCVPLDVRKLCRSVTNVKTPCVTPRCQGALLNPGYAPGALVQSSHLSSCSFVEFLPHKSKDEDVLQSSCPRHRREL